MVSRFLERKDEWVALCEKLLHDGKPEPSPIDLRALAQHTSDRRRSSDIFDVVEKCLEPTPNAKLLAKAIATVRYLVINGAEHVVDRAWRLKDAVGALEKYNSATCGKYGFQRGGRDEGGDVRRRAAELASVLGDVDRIRSLRAEAATHAHRDGPDLRHGQGGAQIVIGAGHSLAEIPGYVAGDDAVALAAQAAAPSARHGFGAGDAPPPAAPAGLVDLLDFDAAPVEAPQAMPDGGLLPTDEQQAVQRQLAQQRGELEQLKQQLAMQQTIAAQQQQLFQLQQRQGGGGALGGGGAMGAPGGAMNGAMGVPNGAMGAFPPAQQKFPPAQQPQFAQQQQRQPFPPQPGFAPPQQQQQRPPQMQQPGFMPQQMPQPGMQQMRQPGMQQMPQQQMPQPGMQQMQQQRMPQPGMQQMPQPGMPQPGMPQMPQPGMPQPGMQQMPQPGFPQQMQQHPPPQQQQYPPQQQQFPF